MIWDLLKRLTDGIDVRRHTSMHLNFQAALDLETADQRPNIIQVFSS